MRLSVIARPGVSVVLDNEGPISSLSDTPMKNTAIATLRLRDKADQAEILRHGKQAPSSDQSRQQKERKSAPSTPQTSAPPPPPPQQQQQQQQPAQAAYNQNEMYAPGQSASAGASQRDMGNSKAPIPSPNYREEAEKIVADERAQSEKMPVYEVRAGSRSASRVFCIDICDRV